MMKSAIRSPESAIPQRQGPTVFPPSAMTAFSALFLVTMMICSEARAQASPGGSPSGQKSPERTVPASEELLRKALKNAKAVAPEDTLDGEGGS